MTDAASRRPTADQLLAALRERVVVADGAMGTMLQAHDLSLDDFEGHEGCNEILNVTRPDLVRGIYDGCRASRAPVCDSSSIRSAMPYSPRLPRLAPNELVLMQSAPAAR